MAVTGTYAILHIPAAAHAAFVKALNDAAPDQVARRTAPSGEIELTGLAIAVQPDAKDAAPQPEAEVNDEEQAFLRAQGFEIVERPTHERGKKLFALLRNGIDTANVTEPAHLEDHARQALWVRARGIVITG